MNFLTLLSKKSIKIIIMISTIAMVLACCYYLYDYFSVNNFK